MTLVRAVCLVSLVTLGGCGGAMPLPPALGLPAADVTQAADRQIIERASMQLSLEDPMGAVPRVEALVQQADGFVENSHVDGNRVQLEVRVPTVSLSSLRDGVRTLGKVDRESVNTADVTGRMSDLDARIQNLIAVRDRLRGYVDRATTVQEVISVEYELARVQTEIDSLTADLERLRRQVAMSHLGLTLNRKRTLGPLAAAGYGVAWAFRKLIFLD